MIPSHGGDTMKTEGIASLTLSRSAYAVATGLFLVGPLGPLKAQSPPAPPPPQASVAAYSQTITVEGTVAQYLMNPDGNVDGILLTDNTLIRVPPHLGPLLVQAVGPQDQVKVNGFTESAGALRASLITGLRTQRSVTDTPPGPGAPPPAPNPAARQSLSASGTIRVLTHAPQGEVDGAVDRWNHHSRAALGGSAARQSAAGRSALSRDRVRHGQCLRLKPGSHCAGPFAEPVANGGFGRRAPTCGAAGYSRRSAAGCTITCCATLAGPTPFRGA